MIISTALYFKSFKNQSTTFKKLKNENTNKKKLEINILII
jgi:hypothetical protein